MRFPVFSVLRSNWFGFGLLLWLTLLLGACATPVRLPSDVADRVAPDDASPRVAWARVLAQHVDAQGRVDFAAVANAPRDLEIWISYVAQVSPRSHPQRFANDKIRLAYYIDAYNGLAMYGVIRSGVMPKQKLRFFLLREYTIGGEQMSLYALENDVIRKLSDPRIHFALNCMSASCPRLPQEPWDSERLDLQLDAAAQEFFNTERHLRVDNSQETVYLSAILDFFPEDFLAVASSLIDYVNGYRRPPVPTYYRVKFIPYDWSVNAQPGTKTHFVRAAENN